MGNRRIPRSRYIELIFFIPLIVYLISVFFVNNSMLNLNPLFIQLSGRIQSIFILFCMLFGVIFNKYTKKEVLILVILCIALFLVRIFADHSPLLDLLIIVNAARYVSLDKLLKVYLAVLSICSLMIVILNHFSIISDRVVFRDGIARLSLGFWHPNTLGIVLVNIFILSLYLYKRKTVFFLIFFNILSILSYQVTGSRTTLILIFLISIVSVCQMVLNERFYKFLKSKYLIIIVFTSCLTFSIISASLYLNGNELMMRLSDLVSNRIMLGARFLNDYGISFFGDKVEYSSPNSLTQSVIGFSYAVLDNIYLKYIINYGLVSTLILGCYLFMVSNKLQDEKRLSWNIYFSIFLIYGLSEQSVFTWTTNFFMLFGVILFKSTANFDRENFE